MKRRSVFQFLITSFLVAVLTVSCGLFGSTDTPQSTTDTQSPVASTQVVKIGAIVPLTGSNAYLGEGERLGMQLALANYPDMESKVSFTFEDSKGKPETALSAARKLLDVQNVNIHIVSTSGVALATLPMYKESGKDLLVFAQATFPKVTKDYPFAYRIYTSADEEARLLASYAKKKGYLRLGALYLRNRVFEESNKLFQKEIEPYGGKVVISESFANEDKDIKPLLEKLKQSNLDAVFVYGFATNLPTIANQMDEVGLKLPVLVNSIIASAGIDKKLPPDFLKQVVFPVPRYFTAKEDVRIQEFNQKVKAAGKDPSIDIAYFYDLASILIQAIKSSPSNSPSTIAASVTKLMPYDGVTGSIKLDSNRDAQVDAKLVKFGANGLEIIDNT